MANLKTYVVRHFRSDGGRPVETLFETESEAMAEYRELRETYRRERITVVDLRNNQVIEDSRKK